ncbi:MAG: HupE/UreJ family protein [Pseudomonadota bacterium]
MSLTTLHGSSRHLTMMCARAVIVFGFSWFAVFAGLWTGLGAANAHEQRPSIVTLTFENSGRYRLAIDTNLEALLAQIGPEHDNTQDSPQADLYNQLRKLEPAELRAQFDTIAPAFLADVGLAFDGAPAEPKLVWVAVPDVGDVDLARASVIEMEGTIPSGSSTFVWAYPAVNGSSALRIERPGQEWQARFFNAGTVSEPLDIGVAVARSNLESFWDYLVVGFTHILPKGLDHILFVLGLFFLSTKLTPLLWQVTAFTVAHSITLALGLYGIVNISPTIVEPLIALSIVYVAVENILVGRLTPWRPLLVFAFGLLHGLGFAGILTEVGLPPEQYVLGLIAFNVGVELGQLTVIAAAFVMVGWFAHATWYRQRIAIPASLVIGAFGLGWLLERTVL